MLSPMTTFAEVVLTPPAVVRAYLQARHTATSERTSQELEARYRTPKERLVGFRGCVFISANADAPNMAAVEEA
jgi:hypothetical protein